MILANINVREHEVGFQINVSTWSTFKFYLTLSNSSLINKTLCRKQEKFVGPDLMNMVSE